MATVKLASKAVGSIVKLKENSQLVEFYVAKHDYENGLNGAGRTLLLRKEPYQLIQWNSSNVNAYAASTIDAWLNNTYKNLLAPDIRSAMGTTKFYYTPGNGNWDVNTLARAVFIVSCTEAGVSDPRANKEGTKLSISNVILESAAQFTWTRSPNKEGTIAALAFKNGILGNTGSTFSCSSNDPVVQPAFTLPSNYYINDNGTVAAPTAPTIPPSITLPAVVEGGSSNTISWAASTDAEGNLAGYKLERSTDGGSTWTQIYQGPALSAANTVPFGTETVQYRVRAYDSDGLHSGYRTSSQVDVLNNQAPGAPGSLTVPDVVKGGSNVEITWTAATDPDGDLTGYSLERQVNGGAWAVVYTGAALTYTDAITKGWQTVAYRVRAYDSHGVYGPYTSSGVCAVDNNTPPVILCDAAEDLGVRSAGFQIAYSVSDPDTADTLSVTEEIDRKEFRSFVTLSGEEQTFDLTGAAFMKLLNGSHTLRITAGDGKAEAVRTMQFVKDVTSASVSLEQPIQASGRISACVLSVIGIIPEDAVFSAEVSSNALDDAPVWEDCTAAVRAGEQIPLANTTAERGFAFNFWIHVERGPSGDGGYIQSVQGGFHL